MNLGTTASPGVFDLAALTAGTYSLPSTASLAGVGTLSGGGKLLAVFGSLAPGNSAGTITVGSGFTLDLSQSGTSVLEITDPAFTTGSITIIPEPSTVVMTLAGLACGGSAVCRRRRARSPEPLSGLVISLGAGHRTVLCPVVFLGGAEEAEPVTEGCPGGMAGGANRSTRQWVVERFAPPTGANRSSGLAGLAGESGKSHAFRRG